MDQPPFMKLVFKMFSVLVAGGKLHGLLIFLSLSTSGFLSLSTISCMRAGEEFKQANISKLHDFMSIFLLLSNEIFATAYKAQISRVIHFLTESEKAIENNPMHLPLVENYNREIQLCCKVFIAAYSAAAFSWYAGCMALWYFASNEGHEECVHLGVGWVWNFLESGYYLTFPNTVFLVIAISRLYIWYLAMFCMIINIKFKIRLLCLDLGTVNEFTGHSEECLESIHSLADSQYRKDKRNSQVQNKTGYGACNNYHGLQTIKEVNKAMDPYIRKYFDERMVEEEVKRCMRNLVKQHIDIIKRVRLLDKTFRHSVMVFVQTGVIVVALAIPKISLSAEFLRPEYIHRGIEAFFIMGCIGLLNYFGQIVLNESESLRHALYNCDWTSKTDTFKQGLLIMQTMATRPLKLTIGGFYTLRMETFSNILSAAYSYISLFQSLNSNEL